MNCFTYFPYRAHYYLLRPHKFIKGCFCNLKMAWQRATKGYCDFDAYDIRTWFSEIMPGILIRMSEKTHSYPTYMTYDQWVETLREIASLLGEKHYENEYKESFLNLFSSSYRFISSTKNLDEKEIEKKYFAREEEIEELSRKEILNGIELFMKYFFDLWS